MSSTTAEVKTTGGHVKIEKFEGPFSVLVQLIDEKKLSINEISLADVTEQYFQYLSQVEERFPEQLADFLVVASRLLLIKSRTLLPDEPESEDEGNLEDQLRLYQAFAAASRTIEEQILHGPMLFARPMVPFRELTPVFAPDASMSLEALREIMQDVLQNLQPVVTLPQTLMERAISLEERIQHIRDHVKKCVQLRFSDILKNATSRTDVVISFLAILELIKQRTIRVSQDAAFHDMLIKRL